MLFFLARFGNTNEFKCDEWVHKSPVISNTANTEKTLQLLVQFGSVDTA